LAKNIVKAALRSGWKTSCPELCPWQMPTAKA